MIISPSAISPYKIPTFQNGGGGFDPDALAFITAAGITGATQIAATNQLFKNFKGEGSTTNNSNFYSKMKAVYPMPQLDDSTATRDGFKFNAVDPRDLDAAFRILWSNEPTATIAGIQGNGTNQSGETYFNPFVHSSLNNVGITASSKTESSDTRVVISSFVGANIFELIIDNNSTFSLINQASYPNFNPSTSIAIFTASRTSSTEVLTYRNGALINTSSANSSVQPNQTCAILARKDDGGLGLFDNKLYDFIAIHEGLTANEAKDLSDTITTYNTALGR